MTSGGDGLKADDDEDATAGYIALLGGAVEVTAGDDALTAVTDVIVGAASLTATADDGAASDSGAKGLVGDVSVVIGEGAEVAVTATDDAVHAGGAATIGGGTVTLASGDDAIHSDGSVTLSGGTATVTEAYEGVEGATIAFTGAEVSITATDDGVNAASDTAAERWIEITGGTLEVLSEGDGIDANGSITMTGGDVLVFGPTTDREGALDADDGLVVEGGTLLAIGAAGMAVAPTTDSAQGWLSAEVAAAAGSTITVLDAEGSELVSVQTPKTAGSVVYSAADVEYSATYTVSVDGAETTVTAGEHTGGTGGGGMAGGGRP